MGGSNIACRVVGISCPFSHALSATLASIILVGKLNASCHSLPVTAWLSVVQGAGVVRVCMVVVAVMCIMDVIVSEAWQTIIVIVVIMHVVVVLHVIVITFVIIVRWHVIVIVMNVVEVVRV